MDASIPDSHVEKLQQIQRDKKLFRGFAVAHVAPAETDEAKLLKPTELLCSGPTQNRNIRE
jgi:hypothetical protein